MVGLLLFAQMALAAYACSGLAGDSNASVNDPMIGATTEFSVSTQAIGASAADCHDPIGEIEAGSANLCAEHCKYGHQSDLVPVVTAPPTAMLARYRLPQLPDAAGLRSGPESMDGRACVSPPHAILHCVFRT